MDIFVATICEHNDLCRFFVESGADESLVNNDGLTAAAIHGE